ncbi:DUF3817 domain-containing protein [Marinactinospora thermotolerans]|uniref:Integral membrane protein n=1 Tax=Marinactinospora thermotolerans DSM 45154 TaxID=1122192 RepID=A0A1T4RU81_9ACTN|nr:DUF3817 domain-containing protein [Marinactinospora thermotolerans]SKA19318.1 integral membrane protein [Marinactinospora thermotolerans DSM 45154]
MRAAIVTAFRVVAAVEAVTWMGLLVGMFFKYVVVHNEIGVTIFGPLHGIAFIVYVILAVLAWWTLRWRPLTGLLALVASVPPLGTVVFERWAAGTGRLAVEPAREQQPA